jgi:hypothetical protein
MCQFESRSASEGLWGDEPSLSNFPARTRAAGLKQINGHPSLCGLSAVENSVDRDSR